MRVQKVMLCPFHCKARSPGSSLQCPELENIPKVPRNRDEVGQNNDTRKAVSATLSVLKLRVNAYKNGPKSPINGTSRKIDFACILSIDRS